MVTLRFLLFFTLLAQTSSADFTPVEIDPSTLSPSTRMARGPHLVYPASPNPNGKLLITLGGTNSLPSDFRALHAVALEKGYRVLALDYPNTVISTSCRESKDLTCFDRFRREIVTGEDVSDLVQVDGPNSIQGRIEALVPAVGLKLDWSRVVLVGHSQGSGHAAYLAKLHKLARVILIAGPQDNFNPAIAPWVKRAGRTPAKALFSLLHKRDFFGSDLQLSVFEALVGGSREILRRNAIVSEKPTQDAHMELIQAKFADDWRRLL